MLQFSSLFVKAKRFGFLVAFATASVLSLPVQAQTETLTNKSVTDLVKAGLDKSIIITTIKNAAADFDLSADGLIALKNAKVDDDIIAAMVTKASGGNAAQTAAPVAASGHPEMVNHPHYYDQPLDKEVGKLGIVTKALGYGGGDQRYGVKGEKARVRVATGNDAAFLINTGGAPLPELTLHEAESKKGWRYVVLVKVKFIGGTESGGKPILYGTTSLGNGVYRIAPLETLEAGEYLFLPKNVGESSVDDFSFAFGIDN